VGLWHDAPVTAPTIGFVTGTGRCGTMTLANVLSRAPGCLSLHEGQVRDGLEASGRPLPHLTLQNLAAYLEPETAGEILATFRAGQIAALLGEHDAVCDVAYYYAPFARALPARFPTSRLAVIVREGKAFVRSAYTSEVPDPMPCGFVDPRELSTHERFCAAGRLRPRAGTPADAAWAAWTPFQKNCWLWAETNRLLLDALPAWGERGALFRFEDLLSGGAAGLEPLLAFLGLEVEPAAVEAVLAQSLNARTGKVLPPANEWSDDLHAQFEAIAGETARRLG